MHRFLYAAILLIAQCSIANACLSSYDLEPLSKTYAKADAVVLARIESVTAIKEGGASLQKATIRILERLKGKSPIRVVYRIVDFPGLGRGCRDAPFVVGATYLIVLNSGWFADPQKLFDWGRDKPNAINEFRAIRDRAP